MAVRHHLEVDLVDPGYPKPYNEYRPSKPSVADVRNIAGIDKRRIIKERLYSEGKFAPKAHQNAISQKIRDTLAILLS